MTHTVAELRIAVGEFVGKLTDLAPDGRNVNGKVALQLVALELAQHHGLVSYVPKPSALHVRGRRRNCRP
ncbi:hypothetical protein CH249_01235 [Rhodococcus sp. 05-2255-3B1]|uniref:hypothetical protein n=1 Tax=unclassified Rhodococcus (in: high G+C Gram-positive bacteria) TaxID=192944 RepID=UPI000B9AEF39|nr:MULTISPECIES: hypothetical protein [unclassified Rhodococcus (in: high G+C Gram-positive bacteria)]OZE13477.1 hypothetical protein CH250_06125 [Rhodococcus sp. 05-2255-3C]OZE15907.1 hypothetical protein CH249_01235 [Rhodococcus sp. 05-2255-3B1]OZE18946.1 hypothetical protein CH255_13260 [Rhodococcus sp. 05-2255-2A2]